MSLPEQDVPPPLSTFPSSAQGLAGIIQKFKVYWALSRRGWHAGMLCFYSHRVEVQSNQFVLWPSGHEAVPAWYAQHAPIQWCHVDSCAVVFVPKRSLDGLLNNFWINWSVMPHVWSDYYAHFCIVMYLKPRRAVNPIVHSLQYIS